MLTIITIMLYAVSLALVLMVLRAPRLPRAARPARVWCRPEVKLHRLEGPGRVTTLDSGPSRFVIRKLTWRQRTRVAPATLVTTTR